MLQTRVYHVVRGTDCWQVVREGFRRPHMVRDSKAEAILMAKRLAKTGPGARVVVHNQDNVIEREFSYSADRFEVTGRAT
jgi:hypothetical protein